MPTVSRYLHCRIDGCLAHFGHRHGLEAHKAKTHRRCSCGWVGTSWNGHVGQRRKLDYDVSGCQLAEPDVRFEMAEVGPWLLPGLCDTK